MNMHDAHLISLRVSASPREPYSQCAQSRRAAENFIRRCAVEASI